MNGELPDEWFRGGARDVDDLDATRIRPLGTGGEAGSRDSFPATDTDAGRPSASEWASAGAARPAPRTPVPDDADERFTDQFKPGYIPRPERHNDTGDLPAQSSAGSGTGATAASSANAPIGVQGSYGENSAGTTYSVGEVQRPAVRRHRRSGAFRVRRGVQTALLLGLALVLGLGGGTWLASHRDDSASTPASASPSSDASAGVPYSGPMKLVTGVRATAECVAPAATASDGSRISYGPDNLLDGHDSTAWRCPGAAIGQKIVFVLPAHTTLVGMGIINGYAKTGSDGSDYYKRYRHVTSVTWTINGLAGAQTMSSVEDEQRITIPPQDIGSPVTLTIDQVSAPGRDDSSANATLMSAVNFYTRG